MGTVERERHIWPMAEGEVLMLLSITGIIIEPEPSIIYAATWAGSPTVMLGAAI